MILSVFSCLSIAKCHGSFRVADEARLINHRFAMKKHGGREASLHVSLSLCPFARSSSDSFLFSFLSPCAIQP
jgi:hypothetical protein